MRFPITSKWHHISYTVSELSQLIVKILDTLRFWASFGGLGNVRCSSWAYWKACSILPIRVSLTFFAGCYGWFATSENRSKIGDFAPTRSLNWPKIWGRMGRPQVEGVAPTNYFSSHKTRLNDPSYCIKIWTDIFSVLSQSTRLTDRQADRQMNRQADQGRI